MIKLSVVFVNYNGKDLLKAALDSVNKNKDHEIIVVDNNSADGSVGFIRKNYKNVRIIENRKNLGYVGINSALPYCKGKYILFLNNDIKIENSCIKELLRVIEKDDRIGMAAPRLINYYNKKLKSSGTWVSRAFYSGHIGNNAVLEEIPYLGVGLIRKGIAMKFGYIFDPDYFIYAEDVDLGLRMRLLGYKAAFAPKAVIYHLHASTTKKFGSSKTTFLLERNLLMTFFKILSLKSILLFLPYVFLVRLFAIVKDVLTFNFRNAFSRIMAVFWVIFNFNIIYEKRKSIQKLRKADDRFILEAFSEKYLFKKPVLI